MNGQTVNIVHALLDDLRDRSGLQDAWDTIDDDTKVEIVLAWAMIIDDNMPSAPFA